VTRRILALASAVLLVATACAGGDPQAPTDAADTAATSGDGAGSGAGSPGPLVGAFAIEAGACADAGVTAGSSFRMVQIGGTVSDGPFVSNGDSPCGDQTWVPLEPGTDGGLVAGSHQPAPEPAFDEAGNALAGAITAPTTWFAVAFATSTNATDPQTGDATVTPAIEHDGEGALTGDLSAWAASWNGQHFNQGSPKPDGSAPGNTTPVTGSYDPDTGRFTLSWTSQIVGGPFNNFTGVWHLEGTFEPA